MASVGPLPPPVTAPIANPVRWIPELPTGRLQQPHHPSEVAAAVVLHGIHGRPLPLGDGAEAGPARLDTPVDVETPFHARRGPAGEMDGLAGKLRSHPVNALPGAEATMEPIPDVAEATAMTAAATAPEAAAYNDSGLGDGSLADAQRAIDGVRGGGGGGEEGSCGDIGMGAAKA